VRNDAVRRPPPVVKQQAVKRFVFGSGEMIAAKVYGTIVVLAILAAGGKAFQNDLWRLVTLVVATVLVLWLSHVYAYGLAESVRTGRRIRSSELMTIARRELAVPLVAVVPTAVLVLGAVGQFEVVRLSLRRLLSGLRLSRFTGCGTRGPRPLACWVLSLLSRSNTGLGLALVALEVLVA
jgi:hypothetical protein